MQTIIHLILGAVFFFPQQLPDVTAQFNRAIELQRAGQLAEAAGEYRAILKIKPDYAEAHANLGAVLARLGKYDEAVSSYEAALKLNPRLVPILMNIGIAHFRAGQFEKSKDALERFLEHAPDSMQARLLLGIALVELDRSAEAVERLEPAINAGASDPTALYSLGLAYLRLKRDGAREIASRLAANESGLALSRLLTGQTLLAEGDHQKALAELREAAKLNPDLPHLNFSIGMCQLAQGQRQSAIASFEEELRRKPNDFWALYHLALTYEAEKNPDAARKPLDAALKLDPRSPEANALRGKMLVKQGRMKEALAPLEIAVTSDKTESETHYLLARVYQSLGRHEDADKEFAIAQKLKVNQVDREKADAGKRQ